MTGATGAVGRHVARMLPADAEVRLLVRDVAKARRAGLRGEPVPGDYQDRPGLDRALRGADAVFVVTANPLRPADDENILAAARAGGVRRAVKLSWLGVADPAEDGLIARWNRDAEARLRASGLDWTVLRMRTPMSNTLAWAPSIRAEGVVRALGGSVRSACVDPRDVAGVAVRALTAPGHAGRTYALTGPAPISVREQVRELSRVLRRPIGLEELTADQALARWRERLPEPLAQALLEAAVRRAGGASARTEGDVEAVTGRAPEAFASWAADHEPEFR
ncbi:NAD(P)H-binding protein [Streptomyces nojiriensis]